jgi:hypothetical protein
LKTGKWGNRFNGFRNRPPVKLSRQNGFPDATDPTIGLKPGGEENYSRSK